MRIAKEKVDKIPLEEKDRRLLTSNISDINELNSMTGKDFYLDWQDFHNEYSPERTDPCPDYYGYFSIRENSYDSTIGEMYPTVKELDDAILVLMDSFSTMGYNFYYDIGKGWYRLMREVILEIDEYNFEHPGTDPLKITDVKEKFGELRISTNYYVPEVDEVIDAITNKSRTVCENCGKEAETYEIHGWLHTLCKNCKNKLFNN